MWPNLDDTWPFGRPVGHTCLGLAVGAVVVLIAIATGTVDDGWRLTIYVPASAVSGAVLWLGDANRFRTRAAGAAAGQFLVAFGWAWPLAAGADGLVLIWPLFAVPAGVALMAVVGFLGARGSRRRQ